MYIKIKNKQFNCSEMSIKIVTGDGEMVLLSGKGQEGTFGTLIWRVVTQYARQCCVSWLSWELGFPEFPDRVLSSN